MPIFNFPIHTLTLDFFLKFIAFILNDKAIKVSTLKVLYNVNYFFVRDPHSYWTEHLVIVAERYTIRIFDVAAQKREANSSLCADRFNKVLWYFQYVCVDRMPKSRL